MTMSNKFRVVGIHDGTEVPLPEGLDGLVIETPSGGIYIDLAAAGLGGVIVRGVSESGKRPAVVMSILETGRLLLGVAHGKG
jgi:hypothetical protein